MADLSPLELPGSRKVFDRSRELAADTSIGRTRFMDKAGVSSEAEFKEICIREGRITFHAHVGLNDWEATAQALDHLERASADGRFSLHRAGICLDRRMALPRSYWDRVPAETGPMLTHDTQWAALGQASAIQPHMGDFMIGFPASVTNTAAALTAGVTTIGNLSQFFSMEAPLWKDRAATSFETATAMALMGCFRGQGALMHSYLEDGFGALFYDCTTMAGWALLEKYIVEELLGARISHCIGGLTSDPVKRAGWVFALDEIHDHACLGSMIYGDTISFTRDPMVNAGLVGEYLLWDILAQLECPTGHAVLPLPLTEGIRIPSLEEIQEAQILGARTEATARRLHAHVDFSSARAFARRVVKGGKQVFSNAVDGLKDMGVDLRDPVALLYVLKTMGAARFETWFGAGVPDADAARGRAPVIPTDVFEMSLARLEEHRPLFLEPEHRALLEERNLVIASSDVHEHAVLILERLCREAGARVHYLGVEKDPDQVARAAMELGADGVFLSTHNGMALEYARKLKQELAVRDGAHLPVVFGGVLNQKTETSELPVDVSREISDLGFIAHGRLKPQLMDHLKAHLT
ncbi:MAG: cobalamin-dependent protein [Desulfobacterales bacterium]|nr:cobalamin-dependent protein [Desulfobacterales bacterium]